MNRKKSFGHVRVLLTVIKCSKKKSFPSSYSYSFSSFEKNRKKIYLLDFSLILSSANIIVVEHMSFLSSSIICFSRFYILGKLKLLMKINDNQN